jgi:ABC-type nitrate/sulfonate/bicarbonate transport system ATPase subunit
MRQRVAFLRTLMAGRPVLLLDEPFASLDAITRAEMQSWLASVLREDRHTVLLVTHDVEEALYLSDGVLVLSPRPASVADRIEIDAPRSEDRAAAVTSPEFAALKERALRSLAGGPR